MRTNLNQRSRLAVAAAAAIALSVAAPAIAADEGGPTPPPVPIIEWVWTGASAGEWQVTSPLLELASSRVQAASSATLGRDVEVWCAKRASWRSIVAAAQGPDRSPLTLMAFAYAASAKGPIVIRPRLCGKLELVAAGKARSRAIEVKVVAALSHELGHVAGNIDEHDASCWGAMRSKRLAIELGLDRPIPLRRSVIAYQARKWGDKGCTELAPTVTIVAK